MKNLTGLWVLDVFVMTICPPIEMGVLTGKPSQSVTPVPASEAPGESTALALWPRRMRVVTHGGMRVELGSQGLRDHSAVATTLGTGLPPLGWLHTVGVVTEAVATARSRADHLVMIVAHAASRSVDS